MDIPETIHGTVSVGLIIAVITFVYHFATRLSKMEVKLDTLWDFQMRKASVEVVTKGAASMNSPIFLNDKAREWFIPFSDRLKEFYTKIGSKLSARDLFIEVEKSFGDDLTKAIDIPHKLLTGSSVLLAVLLIQELAAEDNAARLETEKK